MKHEEARETLRRELLREAEEQVRTDFAMSLEKDHPATRNQALIDAVAQSSAAPAPDKTLPSPP